MNDLSQHPLFNRPTKPVGEKPKRSLFQEPRVKSPQELAFEDALKNALASSSFRPAELPVESKPKPNKPPSENDLFMAHFRKPNPSMDSKES